MKQARHWGANKQDERSRQKNRSYSCSSRERAQGTRFLPYYVVAKSKHYDQTGKDATVVGGIHKPNHAMSCLMHLNQRACQTSGNSRATLPGLSRARRLGPAFLCAAAAAAAAPSPFAAAIVLLLSSWPEAARRTGAVGRGYD